MILQGLPPDGNTIPHLLCFTQGATPASQKPLEAVFADLQAVKYPEIEWDLLTNEAFSERMLVRPTLEKAGAVATRPSCSCALQKLLDLAGMTPTSIAETRTRPEQDTTRPKPNGQ